MLLLVDSAKLDVVMFADYGSSSFDLQVINYRLAVVLWCGGLPPLFSLIFILFNHIIINFCL